MKGIVGNEKILFIDIEITPLLGYQWRVYKDSMKDIKEDRKILCIGYKWKGGKCKVLATDTICEAEVLRRFFKLLDKADVVVSHNGDRFDLKFINYRAITLGFKPPKPVQSIDTLKIAKKVGLFAMNSLSYLCKSLGLEHKTDMGGMEVIKGCMEGDKVAWRHMKKYNKNDVVILEQLYMRLLPWIENHPSLAVINDMPNSCPNCNGWEMRQGGFFVTKAGRRKRYQCLECGHWTKGKLIKSDYGS